MLYKTLNAEEKERMKENRKRQNSEGNSDSSSSERSGSEEESVCSESLLKIPLKKMVSCDVDDLEWDVETGMLKQCDTDDEFAMSESEDSDYN